MRSLMEMLSGRPTVSLVIHRSQLLWRVSSLDSWFLDKAHDSAAPCRRTDKTMASAYIQIIIIIIINALMASLSEGININHSVTL